MEQLPTDRTRPPTIREVAQRAGVSHQTVARYIKSHGVGIKPATIEKVSAAIEELGYRPNLVARAMRARRTDAVAIVLPQGTAISSLEVLAGATQLTDEAGLRLEVVFVGGDVDARTDRVVEMSRSGLFDGILSLVDLDEQHLSGGCPVVTTPLYDEQMRGQGALAEASCVRTIIERLAELGHRRFIHVSGDLVHASAQQRRQVYLDTITELGLESHGVVDGDWSGESGLETVLSLPSDRSVTALIAANDVIAAGAARGALQRGWRVPDDLSIAGWDAHALGDWLTPSLTTVAMDYVTVGRRAMQALLTPDDPQPTPLSEGIATVVWRESTGPRPT